MTQPPVTLTENRRPRPASARRTPARRAAAVASALLLALAGLRCAGPLFAPDGSKIEIAATPTTLVAGGDTAIVTAVVTEDDGRWVDDETRVTFTATGGTLCHATHRGSPPAVSCDSAAGGMVPALSVSTKDGLATVVFVSGAAPGSIPVKATSAGATGTVALTVSGLLAPQTAKVAVQSSADTLEVGGSATVVAFFSTAEGGAVANGTRVVFAADGGALSRTLASTQDGFARTTVTASRPGPLVVTASSGLATGTDSLVARGEP